MNASDIVARLRVCSDNAKEQAADEIERLRKERDDARQLINAAADVIERLRKERDAARREVCRIYANPGVSVFLLAERRGWDCFKGVRDDR